jgi:hypothetical protein
MLLFFYPAASLPNMYFRVDSTLAMGFVLFSLAFYVGTYALTEKCLNKFAQFKSLDSFSKQDQSLLFWIIVSICLFYIFLFWFYGYYCFGDIRESAFITYQGKFLKPEMREITGSSVSRLISRISTFLAYGVPFMISYLYIEFFRKDSPLYKNSYSWILIGVLFLLTFTMACRGARAYLLQIPIVMFPLFIIYILKKQVFLRRFYFLSVGYLCFVCVLGILIPVLRSQGLNKSSSIITKNSTIDIVQSGVKHSLQVSEFSPDFVRSSIENIIEDKLTEIEDDKKIKLDSIKYDLSDMKLSELAENKTIPHSSEATVEKKQKYLTKNKSNVEKIFFITNISKKSEIQHEIKEIEREILKRYKPHTLSDYAACIMAFYGRHKDYGGLMTAPNFISFCLVPRVWFPNKPRVYGTQVVSDIREIPINKVHGSIYAGPFHEGFYAWGYCGGIIYSIIFGLIAGILSQLAVSLLFKYIDKPFIVLFASSFYIWIIFYSRMELEQVTYMGLLTIIMFVIFLISFKIISQFLYLLSKNFS